MKNYKNYLIVLLVCIAVTIIMQSDKLGIIDKPKQIFVIVHGATGGGWAWKDVGNKLTSRGHTVYRPTLTGLGERVHLASPDIDLSTHINDVVNLIKFEGLGKVVLVGHSYGGMVITGVMNSLPERVEHATFLDAAVPDDGMSAIDIWSDLPSKNWVKDGLVYFPWIGETEAFPRDVPQSYKTFTEPVTFSDPDAINIPGTFIAFIAADQDVEIRKREASWQRAVARNWTIRTLKSDHNANLSHPEELVNIIEEAVRLDKSYSSQQ